MSSLRSLCSIPVLALLAACGGSGSSPAPALELQVYPESGVEPLPVCVSNLADLSDPHGWSYEWDFGDGQKSTERTACPTYAKEGVYTLSVVVRSAGGEVRGSRTITVEDAVPAARFSYYQLSLAEGSRAVQFQSTSEAYDEPMSLSWDFGDGTTDQAEEPLHVYHGDGPFTVRLTATDADGDTAEEIDSVWFMDAAPVAKLALSAQRGPEGLMVVFDARGSAVPVGPSTFSWSFGDGESSTLPLVVHTYPRHGSYPIELVVRDADGVEGRASATVEVEDSAPSVDFSVHAANPADPLELALSPDGSFARDGLAAFRWNFGDGETSSERAPVHAWAAPGTYLVELELTDGDGSSSTLQRAVTVPLAATPSVATGQPGGTLRATTGTSFTAPRAWLSCNPFNAATRIAEGTVSAVLAEDGWLYAWIGDELRSYDLSDPRHPVQRSAVALPTQEGPALVTYNRTRRQISLLDSHNATLVDASDPAALAVLSTSHEGVSTSSATAAIADGEESFSSSIYTLTASVGQSSTMLSIPGLGSDLARVGPLVFVADGGIGEYAPKGSGLFVAELGRDLLSEQPKLFELARSNLEIDAADVAAGDGLVLVADNLAGLNVYDVADPKAPQRIGSLAWPARKVVLGEKRAYLVRGSSSGLTDGRGLSRIAVVDLAQPASPRLAGELQVPDSLIGVAGQGETLYLAGYDGLWSVDARNPTPGCSTKRMPLDTSGLDEKVAGGHLLRLEAGSDGNPVVAIRDLRGSAPGEARYLAIVQGFHASSTGLEVFGDLGVVLQDSDSGGLNARVDLIDLEDPSTASVVASIPVSSCTTATRDGNLLFIGQWLSEVAIYDISDRTAPVQVGSLRFGIDRPIGSLGAVDGLLFASFAADNRIQVADVSTPSAPAVRSTLAICPQEQTWFLVGRGHVLASYWSASAGRTAVLSYGTPAAPAPEQLACHEGMEGPQLFFAGNELLASRTKLFDALDLTQPMAIGALGRGPFAFEGGAFYSSADETFIAQGTFSVLYLVEYPQGVDVLPLEQAAVQLSGAAIIGGTSLTAPLPALAPGVYDLVLVEGGHSETIPAAVTVAAP